MEPVNLGRKYEPCCASPASLSKGDNISFPTVYLENLPDGMKLPKSGTITFRYEMSNINERVRDESTCYNMDLLQVVSVESKAEPKVLKTGADALAQFVAEKNGDDEDEEKSDRESYVADGEE